VIIILGFFAFFQWEFNLTVLAAVLAVLGYSVNESVVIFDRIREAFRRFRKMNTHEVIDHAITSTMSRTIKRAPARRPVPPRRKPPRVSLADRLVAVLPISEHMLHRIVTWSIFGLVMAGLAIAASVIGIPGAVGTAIAEGIGRAGFRVEQIEVTGLSRADRMAVYADALDQKSRAMPLIDLEAVREKLLARQGWIQDAHVSRRLPDTLLIHIVERKPSAIWQNQGKLALIADNGVMLERISADAMPDLPLLIGPGANTQEAAYLRLLDVAPALKPLVKAATWVGNRRWNLTFPA